MFFFWIIQVWWSCWIWNKGYHRYNQGYFLLWPTPIDWQWASVCWERNSDKRNYFNVTLPFVWTFEQPLHMHGGIFLIYCTFFVFMYKFVFSWQRVAANKETKLQNFSIYRDMRNIYVTENNGYIQHTVITIFSFPLSCNDSSSDFYLGVIRLEPLL